MNKHLALTRLGFALALSLIGAQTGHAQTAAASSAQLRGLAYHLVDLDPADGIAPSVSFSGPDNTAGGLAGLSLRTLYASTMAPDVTQRGGLLFSDASASLSNAAQTQSASMNGGDFATAVTASVAELSQPAVLGGTPDLGLLYYGDAMASTSMFIDDQNGYNIVDWKLSPHTRLVIDGTAELHTSSDVALLDGASTLPGAVYSLSLSSYSTISTELTTFDGGYRRAGYNGLAYASSILGEGTEFGDDDRKQDLLESFSFEMANTSASEMTGQFTVHVDSSVSLLLRPSHPVPEPGTWLLMGVGLISLGALARRRHPSIASSKAAPSMPA